VVFRTQSLFATTLSRSHTDLSDKVIRLRDKGGLPYWQIAETLAAEGYRGARGATLDAKGVFSVYKKRKRRIERLNRVPTLTIPRIEVTYAL